MVFLFITLGIISNALYHTILLWTKLLRVPLQLQRACWWCGAGACYRFQSLHRRDHLCKNSIPYLGFKETTKKGKWSTDIRASQTKALVDAQWMHIAVSRRKRRSLRPQFSMPGWWLKLRFESTHRLPVYSLGRFAVGAFTIFVGRLSFCGGRVPLISGWVDMQPVGTALHVLKEMALQVGWQDFRFNRKQRKIILSFHRYFNNQMMESEILFLIEIREKWNNCCLPFEH